MDINEQTSAKHSEVQTLPENYLHSILRYLKEDDVDYMHFATITENIFPCIYNTKRAIYKHHHTFVVNTNSEIFLNIHKENAIKPFFNSISKEGAFFGVYKKNRHKPNYKFKNYICSDWDKPVKAYRVLIGHTGSEAEILQILFIENSNYELFCKNFYNLHFHR